jgi:hypothetical protein
MARSSRQQEKVLPRRRRDSRQTAVTSHEQKPPAQPSSAVRTHEQPRSLLGSGPNFVIVSLLAGSWHHGNWIGGAGPLCYLASTASRCPSSSLHPLQPVRGRERRLVVIALGVALILAGVAVGSASSPPGPLRGWLGAFAPAGTACHCARPGRCYQRPRRSVWSTAWSRASTRRLATRSGSSFGMK